MTRMGATDTANTAAKLWGRASILNSLLLPAAAALGLDVTFWVLVLTNFVAMHAIWLVQKRRGAVDFGLVKWPLIAFAVLGNAALLVWGERLLAVFPS